MQYNFLDDDRCLLINVVFLLLIIYTKGCQIIKSFSQKREYSQVLHYTLRVKLNSVPFARLSWVTFTEESQRVPRAVKMPHHWLWGSPQLGQVLKLSQCGDSDLKHQEENPLFFASTFLLSLFKNVILSFFFLISKTEFDRLGYLICNLLDFQALVSFTTFALLMYYTLKLPSSGIYRTLAKCMSHTSSRAAGSLNTLIASGSLLPLVPYCLSVEAIQ